MRNAMKALANGTAAMAITLAATASPVWAQDKVELVYSDMPCCRNRHPYHDAPQEEFGGSHLGDSFDFKSYHGATLFKQGLQNSPAMQRGNLDA
ncbi:MAG: hypothetical protein H6893_09385 [Brucellaceae bacterium]|nr:hypothetical protein [Brucellaceae bacterium]